MKFSELDQSSFWQILQLTQKQGKYVLETFKAKTDAFMDRFEDPLLIAVNRVLELAAPVAIFLWIVFTYPALATWRFLTWLFTLPWDMRNRVVLVLGASSGIGAVSALAEDLQACSSAKKTGRKGQIGSSLELWHVETYAILALV